MLTAITAITVWAFIFSVTGLFVRYSSGHSPIMRKISDAAYWIFLVHLHCWAWSTDGASAAWRRKISNCTFHLSHYLLV
jgi:hypothetical protein